VIDPDRGLVLLPPVPSSSSQSPRAIRILLVDDHSMIRMGLAAMLQIEPDLQVVAEAESGTHALAQFRHSAPDVTLMDIRMGGGGGLSALRAILEENPDARVVMLTTYDKQEDIHTALQSGAYGYLLKSINRLELVEAIRQVHAGHKCIPPEVARQLALRNSAPSLAPREIQVLAEVGKGAANKEIAATLGLSENTVRWYLKSIFAKLDASDRAGALSVAIRRGIIGEDEDTAK
jgi:DNA-binding NarL/FixJ family response regulator